MPDEEYCAFCGKPLGEIKIPNSEGKLYHWECLRTFERHNKIGLQAEPPIKKESPYRSFKQPLTRLREKHKWER